MTGGIGRHVNSSGRWYYTQADLATLLGSRSRASEILAGRRGLTMAQIRRLHKAWNIPAEALIQPVRVRSQGALDPVA